MGCGTLEWSTLFEHSAGILTDEEDAPVAEHLHGCDACRRDGAELMVLSERLREVGALTAVQGREAFADRTRYDVRSAMGESRATRISSAWRVTSDLTESQRIRRFAARRRRAIARTIGIAAAVVVAPVLLLILAYVLGLVDHWVDRYGESIEATAGIDLASWGLRPDPAGVAKMARSVPGSHRMAEVREQVERLVVRELSSGACRLEALTRLEFAAMLTREQDPAAAELVAVAVEDAGAVPAGDDRLAAEALSVVRRARACIASGSKERARALLDLMVTAGSDVAIYYAAVAAEGDAPTSPVKQLAEVAARVPSVWIEIAWRYHKGGEKASARTALDRAPGSRLRGAAESFMRGTAK